MSDEIRTRPILFQGAMVRALLDGKKSQTRRIAKLPHQNPLGQWEPTTMGGPNGGRTSAGNTIPEQGAIWHTRTGDCLMCPKGQPGDQLWVRETWYCDDYRVQKGPYLKPDDFDVAQERETGGLVYVADGLRPYEAEQPVWRPSIHMPRWASRITLEITAVRVERLQNISEADAIAEGVGHADVDAAVADYAALWDRINGLGSWSTNPWAWVVEFNRVQP